MDLHASVPPLADRLAGVRRRGPQWAPLYDRFVAALEARGVGAAAPQLGERMDDFALPDATGAIVSLHALAAQGPVVLSFQRGVWCPYCREETTSWGEHAEALAALGAHFVAVTAEVGGRAAELGDMAGPEAVVLSDIDHGVALSLGLAFHLDAALERAYREAGLDLTESYGSPAGFLPVPATFVLDADAVVRFRFVDPDFRRRAEPAAVLEALARVRG